MPSLVIQAPDGKQHEVAVSGDMTIGRGDTNDLVLAGGGVSRKHAVVSVKGEQILVEDAGSANGTFIDGERIEGKTPFSPGKILQIGDYELRIKVKSSPSQQLAVAKGPQRIGVGDSKGNALPHFSDPGQAPSTKTIAKPPLSLDPLARQERAKERAKERALAPARQVRDVPEGPVLIGISSVWARRRYHLKGKRVVGRLAGCDLVLDDDSVSRRHAELEVGPNGVRLKDLRSANGTAVNGNPLQGAVMLQPGDVVQFGVVELRYENDLQWNPLPKKRSKSKAPLIIVGALALTVGAGGALFKVFQGQQLLRALGPARPATATAAAAATPDAQLSDFLTKCREYSHPPQGEPDLAKAETACRQVLAIEPVQEEATALLRMVKIEQESLAHFEQGDKLLLRLRNEEALAEYGAIPPTSHYYVRAKPKIKEALEQSIRRTAEDCNTYFVQREYKQALQRCEAWLKLACQDMEKDAVTPPTGYTVRTAPRGKLKPREWLPKNPMVLKFYQVRERVDPKAGIWHCDRMEILARGPQEESTDKAAQRLLAQTYPHAKLLNAVMDYWRGRTEESRRALQKLRDDMQFSEIHGAAMELSLTINDVASQYKTGQTYIQANEVEKAAERFDEALVGDRKLLGDTTEKYPSWFRDSIVREIASASLESGRTWMRREDRKAACKLWRVGFRFYKGNPELNRAIANQCSTKANELLQTVTRCEELEGILALAVEGDGVKEKVMDKRAQWQCP